MPWQVSADGAAETLVEKLTHDFAAIQIVGAEGEIKDAAATLALMAAHSQAPGTLIRVVCSGDSHRDGEVLRNSVCVLVEPLYSHVVDHQHNSSVETTMAELRKVVGAEPVNGLGARPDVRAFVAANGEALSGRAVLVTGNTVHFTQIKQGEM